MLTADARALPPFDRLVYWIREREAIRLRRLRGEPPPWTDDPILRAYRFCNVRRMDDAVSQWLMRNWYITYRDHPNMVTAAVLARQLNTPDALDAVGFPDPWDPDWAEEVLSDRAARGLKNFSAAYIITGTLGGTKIHQVVRKVVDAVATRPPQIDRTSMAASVAALVPYPGLGSFIAGQVVADLRWAVTGTWEDRCRWAPVGPGSARGMNRLHGRPVKQPLGQAQFTDELAALTDRLQFALPASITSRLEAIDYQNCLCESNKMSRTLDGEGRPKQLYRGGA